MVAFARGCTRIAAVVARYCWRKARYRRERRAGLVWPCPFDDVSRRRTVCTFCDKAARLRVSSSLFAVPRRLNLLRRQFTRTRNFLQFLCVVSLLVWDKRFERLAKWPKAWKFWQLTIERTRNALLRVQINLSTHPVLAVSSFIHRVKHEWKKKKFTRVKIIIRSKLRIPSHRRQLLLYLPEEERFVPLCVGTELLPGCALAVFPFMMERASCKQFRFSLLLLPLPAVRQPRYAISLEARGPQETAERRQLSKK